MTDSRLLLSNEEERILREWNRTDREYPSDKCLHDLIEEQVRHNPDNPAVRFNDQQISFAELNSRSNRCARYLRGLGVGSDTIVGVLMERSIEMVVALVGILKSGGCYLPLDPTYPADRLRFMLDDAGVSIIFTQEKYQNIAEGFEGSVLCLDSEWTYLAEEPDDDPESVTTPDSLAYVIYTSGSTGKPKGCLIPHRAICNRLLWMREKYRLTGADRVLQKTPYTFDVSVWEFFWPLLAGACLVMAKPGGHKDSNYLVDIIRKQGITTCHFVPSMLRFFVSNSEVGTCKTLRQVFTSGEALPFDVMMDFKRKLEAKLHNLYGPTEAAVDVSYWECEERADKKVPIGRPISNIRLYILDNNLSQVPIGEEGELYIGGIGLAKGYLNRPELTRERFVGDPFGADPGSRLYKTGDRARFLADGNIEFLGRMDFQIKLRGNRIELGEIEETLRSHEAISEAVVTVRNEASGDPKLVAYIVSKNELPSSKQIREFVKRKLPDYMVPNIIVPLDSLPVTGHGKINREALPWPVADDAVQNLGAAPDKPRTNPGESITRVLLDYLEKTMETSGLRADSDLFDRGATSFTLVRLVETIQKQYGVSVPLAVFLDDPTVKAIVDYLGKELEGKSGLRASQEQNPDPAETVQPEVVYPGKDTIPVDRKTAGKEAIVTALIELLNEISGAALKADDDLFDKGATSFTMVQIVGKIQKIYNVNIPVDVFLAEPSVRALADYIAQTVENDTDIGKEAQPQDLPNNRQGIESYKKTTEQEKTIRLEKTVFKGSAYQKSTFTRNYVKEPISFNVFSGFLSLLKQATIEGSPKYLYPSAGGLNAIQSYVYVRENAVEGLVEGIYYYHPEEHTLCLIDDRAVIEDSIFLEYDRPVFKKSGFILFFIAQLDAITPEYQGVSPSLVTLDAGYMAQLMLSRQQDFNVGVCPVAGVDFDRIGGFFKLGKGHRFIHCLLGGVPGKRAAGDDGFEPGLPDYLRKTGTTMTSHFRNNSGDSGFSSFLDIDWKTILKNIKYLTLEEHEHFLAQRLNIRRFTGNEPVIALEQHDFRESDYRFRYCRRDYSEKPIPFAQFSRFMSLLKPADNGSRTVCLYPSLSGMFGIKSYLYIKRNGVEGLAEGIYYYDPARHALILVTSQLTNKVRNSYTPFNRKHYQRSAFCLYLVAQLDQFEPIYKDDSRYFALMDAGYLGQLLMCKQAEFDIGVCPIGGLDFDKIRSDFKLDDRYELLHSFTCGSFEQELPGDWEFLEINRGGIRTQAAVPGSVSSQPSRSASPHDLAIVGISGRYPGAENIDEFWENLRDAKSSIRQLPEHRRKLLKPGLRETGSDETPFVRGGYLEDIDCFDNLIFNISPAESGITDPQERLFMESVWECLENSGYTADSLIRTSGKIGVFVGAMWNDYQNQSSNRKGDAGAGQVSAFHSSIANRVSYFFNFNGPSIAINTSCSSAMTAVHLGCESIKRGECNAVLVGGINLMTHSYHQDLLASLDILSKDGECRPLGAQATGWLPGEGVGVILIKPVLDAERDRDYIYGIIKGTAIGHSGRTVRFGAPSSTMQAESMRTAIESAAIPVESISYIEMAASGSSIADAAEADAVRKVFSGRGVDSHLCLIGSLKANIGHLESASAMSQIAKVLLQMKHRRIAPTVNFKPVNPLIELKGSGLEIADGVKPWRNPSEENNGKPFPLRALINAFGATGSGGHIILEEYLGASRQDKNIEKLTLIPVSAATGEQLYQQVKRLYEFLSGHRAGFLNLSDVGYTLRMGRVAMEERAAFVVYNTRDLFSKMEAFLKNEPAAGIYRGTVLPGEKLSVETEQKDLFFIAGQWVKGAAIDWHRLDDGSERKIPLPTYPFAMERHWFREDPPEPGLRSVGKTDRQSPVLSSVERERSGGEKNLFTRIADYLKALFSQAAEIPVHRINSTVGLERYGINSIMINRLNLALEKDFGELPRTLFFEYQTINELAQYFLQSHPDRARVLLDHPESSINPTDVSFPGKVPVDEENLQTPRGFEPDNRKNDIAIIGLSGRYPKAKTIDELWENLKNGTDCIGEIPLERWDYRKYFDPDHRTPGKIYSKWGGFIDDADKFDPLFFNISAREAEIMDPQERLFLETAWHTFEDAGYSQGSLRKTFEGSIGVFVGVMYGEYQLLNDADKINSDRLAIVSSYGSIANRVSYTFDFHGPSMAIDTLCSSSLTALHLAAESIKRGECKAAIAGGVNLSIHPSKYIVHSQLAMSSTDGHCRSFGEGGDGFVPGEGVGAVLLKPLSRAIADHDRIYGIIKGSAVNHGGKTNGYTVPNPVAQGNLIRETLNKSGIAPETIGYVEAHGTGTSLGDPIEIAGLCKSFGDTKKQYCPIGSIKSNIGHLEAAAGIASLTKVLLQMKHKKLAPSLFSDRLNPNINFERTPFFVQQELTDWNPVVIEVDGKPIAYPRRAAISAFGAGGANTHVLVEEYEAEYPQPVTSVQLPQIIVLSARNEERLKVYARRMIDALSGKEFIGTDIRDVAFTLQVGREPMEERLAVIVESFEGLTEKLKEFVEGRDTIDGLYRGPSKPNNETLSFFGEDEDLQKAIDDWIVKGKYTKLATLWQNGLNLDWEKLYDPRSARFPYRPHRISLPTYPFAGERYWVGGVPDGSAADGKAISHETAITYPMAAQRMSVSETISRDTPTLHTPEDSELMTFTETWQEAGGIQPGASGAGIKTLVCFLSEPGNRQTVSETIRTLDRQTEVIFIARGATYQKQSPQNYSLSRNLPDDYRETFRSIREDYNEIDAVLYLWPMEDPGCLQDYSSIVSVLKGMASAKLKPGQFLLTGQYENGLDGCYLESWVGFERSIRLVLPDTKMAIIYREAGDRIPDLKEWLPTLWQELKSQSTVSVLYKKGKRHILRIQPAAFQPAGTLIRKGGTYLISGGFGGLGRLLARHLAQTQQVNLILTGRTPIDADKQREIKALEELGSRVLYVQADVCDPIAMKAGLDSARERFGGIHGTIHAAGIMNRRNVLETGIGNFNEVIDPKIKGTLVLDELLSEDPLDFVCYFSSAAAILGDFGSCDYAIGNRFQMAYACYRNELQQQGRKKGKAVVINWPLWHDIGMSRGDDQNISLYLKSSGQLPLEASEGIYLFENLLADKNTQHLVLKGQRSRVERFLGLTGDPIPAPSLVVSDPGKGWRQELKGLSLEQSLEWDIKELIGKILKIPRDLLNKEKNLADFGFDSITLAEYATRLSGHFGIEITPALFFGHSTIQKLVQYFFTDHLKTIREFYREGTVEQVVLPKAGAKAVVTVEAADRHLKFSVEDTTRNNGKPGTIDEPIAVIGMSGRFSEARNIEEMWDILVKGRDVIKEIPQERFDWRRYYGDPGKEPGETNGKWCGCIPGVSEFDPLFFEISPREAITMDPRQRLLMQEAWRALEDAGYGAGQIGSSQIGMFVGVEQGDYQNIPGYKASITSSNNAILAARLAYFLNLSGPVMAIDTACSSGLVAVHQACRSLLTGECDTAIAAGVNLLLSPESFIGMGEAGMLSGDGRCYAFDKRANGLVPGEAVGAVVLKRQSGARADGDPVYALIKGSGINYDGKTNGITAPSGVSQAHLLKSVYDRFRINPEEIEYIVTHGTGTKLGDPVEINALYDAFKDYTKKEGYCAITSTKPNFGHGMGASGIVSLISLIQALKHSTIPASLHCEQENDYINWKQSPFYINKENRSWPAGTGKKTGAVSAFGMSGTNAHVVIEGYSPEEPAFSPERAPCYLLALSAKTGQALREKAEEMLSFLERSDSKEYDLGAISYTLLAGRQHFDFRCAVVAQDRENAIRLLRQVNGNESLPNLFRGKVAQGFATRKAIERIIPELINQSWAMIHDQNGYQEICCALADLYCQGYEIAADELFGDRKPRRIHLPTYPFARDSYWVSGNGESGKKATAGTAPVLNLHPLLHRNTSTFLEQRFSSTFTGEEFFLADHTIKGQKILPGVAYLEIAREAAVRAAALSGSNMTVRLENIAWERPITVENPIAVDIALYPNENGEITYEISSISGESGSEPVIHSRGSVFPCAVSKPPVLDLEAIKAQCNQGVISGEQCYRIFQTAGYEYGPGHRGIEMLYTGPGRVLAKLSLPAAIARTEDQFVLHPCIVDSALQASVGLIPEPRQNKLLLPFALNKVEIFGRCAASMWAFIRYSEGSKAGDRVEKLDIDLCDEDGNLCVRIIGYCSREIQGETVTEGDRSVFGTLLLEPCWNTETPGFENSIPAGLRRLVILCEPGGILPGNIEVRIKGIRCIALESLHGAIEDRFDEYAVRVFGEIQAIIKSKPSQKILIQVVVFSGGDKSLFGGLYGILATARMENSLISGQVIETDSGLDVGGVIEILNRSAENSTAGRIRFLNGQRLVAGWKDVEFSPENRELRMPWKDGGVYLITGGAGKLGFVFAEEIARQAKEAVIILTGRSLLDADRQDRLAELMSRGTRIEYKQVDVVDAKAVEILIAAIIEEHGTLDGIIHAAGIIHDNFILKKTREELIEVLAPKVRGLTNIDRATMNVKLDFLALFSSVAGAIGNIGQADYSAANAFMDEYAEYRNTLVARGERSGRTLSVNWPLWKEGGMRVDEETKKSIIAKTGVVPLETGKGLPAFYRSLDSGKTRLMVLEGRLDIVRERFFPHDPAYSDRSAGAIDGLGATTAGGASGLSNNNQEDIDVTLTSTDRFDSADEFIDKINNHDDEDKKESTLSGDEELKDRMITYLKHIVAETLKMNPDQLDINTGLDKYGLDSIVVLEINNKLEKHFPELSRTLFFEYGTLNDVADYFAKNHRKAIAGLFGSGNKNVEKEAAPASMNRRFGTSLRNSIIGSGSKPKRSEYLAAGKSGNSNGPKAISPVLSIDRKVSVSNDDDITGILLDKIGKGSLSLDDIIRVTNPDIISGNCCRKPDITNMRPTAKPAVVGDEPLLVHEDELRHRPEIIRTIGEIDRIKPPLGYERLLYPYYFICSGGAQYIRVAIDKANKLYIPFMPMEKDIYDALVRYSRTTGYELLMVDDYFDWVDYNDVRLIPLGVWQNIDISGFTLAGNKMRKLRYLVEKFKNSGEVRTEEYNRTGELPFAGMKKLMLGWSEGKKNIIRHSVVCMEELLKGTLSAGYRAFLTYHDRELCSIIVIGQNGDGTYLMDQEFYDPETAPLGHMEYAITETIKLLKEEKAKIFSLGLTWFPFAFDEHPVKDPGGWTWLKEQYKKPTLLSKIFRQGEANYQFKKKFGDAGKPIYCYVPKNMALSLLLSYWTVFYENSLTAAKLADKIASIPAARTTTGANDRVSPATLNRDERAALLAENGKLAEIDYGRSPLDLMTDSWFSVKSDAVKKREAYLQSGSGGETEDAIREIFPFKHIILTSRGRVAEQLFYTAYPKVKKKILTAIPWTSTLMHQLDNGFDVIELPLPSATKPQSQWLFRGEMDLKGLKQELKNESDNVAMAGIELLSNGSGGHPVRLSHLRVIKTTLKQYAVPLVIDASRIVRNASLIKQYEDDFQDTDIWEIVRQTAMQGEYIVASLTKDFAVPEGGLIATNDDRLAAEIGRIRAEHALDVTDGARKMIIKALSERETIVELVSSQMAFTGKVQDMLIGHGVSVLQPAYGHAVVIDVSRFANGESNTRMKEQFLEKLFIEAGIRAGIHQIGKQKNTILDRCIRIAFPLGLSEAERQSIFNTLEVFFTKTVFQNPAGKIDRGN